MFKGDPFDRGDPKYDSFSSNLCDKYGHSVKEDHPKIVTPHALKPVQTFVSLKANCSE